MRGKKIKVVFQGRRGATPEFNARPQLLGIDGEDLRYKKQVVWEIVPANVEVMFDSDAYFKEFNSFLEESDLSREIRIEKIIFQIWKDFDANNDGKLAKEEVKAFLKTTLGDDWAVEEFDMIFNALDLGDKGFLEPADLFNFMVEKN